MFQWSTNAPERGTAAWHRRENQRCERTTLNVTTGNIPECSMVFRTPRGYGYIPPLCLHGVSRIALRTPFCPQIGCCSKCARHWSLYLSIPDAAVPRSSVRKDIIAFTSFIAKTFSTVALEICEISFQWLKDMMFLLKLVENKMYDEGMYWKVFL